MFSSEPKISLEQTMKKIQAKKLRSKRHLAEVMHRQADNLHRKGDYETALILYHRAANLCPFDVNHGAAARKTEALISSTTATNPAAGDLFVQRKRGKKNGASRTSERDATSKGDKKKMRKLAKSPMMSMKLRQLRRVFGEGNWKACLRIGNELLEMTEDLSAGYDSTCYQLAAHRLLTLTYLSMGRHDRAISQSTKMTHIAKVTGDIKLQLKSFAILGKIHLTFGHLDAAAKAWEKLSRDMREAISKAWMLHEIGSCYFEMEKYTKSLEMAKRCCEWAEEADSMKWLYHGKLLVGQALIQLGRFAEALESLRYAAQLAELQSNDPTTIHYIKNLMVAIEEKLRLKLTVKRDTFNSSSGSWLETCVIKRDVDEKCNPTIAWNERLQSRSSSCQVIDKWKSLLSEKEGIHIMKEGL